VNKVVAEFNELRESLERLFPRIKSGLAQNERQQQPLPLNRQPVGL
jgi:hypothetical protein